MGNKHPNLKMLERGMAAFAAKDLATLAQLFVEGLIWHHGGRSILAGDYVGVDEVFTLFARRAAMTDDTYRVQVLHAAATDSVISVVSRIHAERAKKSYDDELVSVYRIDEAGTGRVVEAWHHPAHPKHEAQFFGR